MVGIKHAPITEHTTFCMCVVVVSKIVRFQMCIPPVRKVSFPSEALFDLSYENLRIEKACWHCDSHSPTLISNCAKSGKTQVRCISLFLLLFVHYAIGVGISCTGSKFH
jgi:hypothetical protein